MDLAVSTPDPAGAAPEPSPPAGTVAYGYQSSTDSPAPTSVRAAPAASAMPAATDSVVMVFIVTSMLVFSDAPPMQ